MYKLYTVFYIITYILLLLTIYFLVMILFYYFIYQLFYFILFFCKQSSQNIQIFPIHFTRKRALLELNRNQSHDRIYILYHENIWLCGEILRIIICALTRFNWYCFYRGADVVTASIRYRIIIHGFLGRTRMFCITWICGAEILLRIYSLKFFLIHE